MITLLLAAAVLDAPVSFSVYVPPHAASDGDRYEIVLPVDADLTSDFRACGIADFARMGTPASETIYQFAVTRASESAELCLKARLPQGARLDHEAKWIIDAQAH